MRSKKCKICGDETPENFYSKVNNMCKKHTAETFIKWTKNNLMQYRFVSARNRAKYKNIEFSIVLEDLENIYKKQGGRCYYTNLLFDSSEYGTYSIDRIDSNLGYTKDNIRLTAACVNYMKNDMEESIFLKVVKLIANNQNVYKNLK